MSLQIYIWHLYFGPSYFRTSPRTSSFVTPDPRMGQRREEDRTAQIPPHTAPTNANDDVKNTIRCFSVMLRTKSTALRFLNNISYVLQTFQDAHSLFAVVCCHWSRIAHHSSTPALSPRRAPRRSSTYWKATRGATSPTIKSVAFSGR